MAKRKYRNWWFVQQLDYLPDDWVDQLAKRALPFFYITHDRDTKLDDDGQLVAVKPHIHCVFMFGNAVQVNTALNAIPDSFGVHYIEPVPKRDGAARYMLHLDYEDKALYSYDELHFYNGAQVDVNNVLSTSFLDVVEFIELNGIQSFRALINLAAQDRNEPLVRYCVSHISAVKTYLADVVRDGIITNSDNIYFQ